MLKKKNWIQIVLSLLCSIFLAVMAGNINSEGTISFAMLGLFLLSLIALLFSAKVQGKDDLKNKILETFKFLGITFMSAVILSTVYGIVSQILLTQIGSYVVTNTAIIMITMFLAPIFLLNVFSEKLTLELSNRYLKVLLLELIFIGMGLIIPFNIIVYSLIGFAFLMSVFAICKMPQTNILAKIYKPAVAMMLVAVILSQTLIQTEILAGTLKNNYNATFPELEDKVAELNKNIFQKNRPLREPKNYYNSTVPKGKLIETTEFTRTYKIDETNFVTEYSLIPNTYVNDLGNEIVIDNSLKREGTSYFGFGGYFTNEDNYYNAELPVYISETNGIRVENGNGNIIELIPIGGDMTKPFAKDNMVLYNDVFDGVDYQYTLLNTNIKEDIILNKHIERNEFEFEIKNAGNLYLCEESGMINVYESREIFESANAEPLFSITAPIMTDASGETSDKVTLKLEEHDGKYIAKVIADKEWLDSPQRSYPVRIDPTINIPNSDIKVNAVKSYYSGEVGDNGYTYIGWDNGGDDNGMQRTYLEFNYDFSQISSEARISSAYVSLWQTGARSGGISQLGVYDVSGDWKATGLYSRTWNNQPDISTHTYISQVNAAMTAGYLSWEITDTVALWVADGKTGGRLVFKAMDERYQNAECFYTSVTGYEPKFTNT